MMTQSYPLLPLRDIVVFPGMVVPLFPPVVRAIVIFVPMLVVRTTKKRRIVGVGHDGPVFAQNQIARP